MFTALRRSDRLKSQTAYQNTNKESKVTRSQSGNLVKIQEIKIQLGETHKQDLISSIAH